jgi:hypothetical protein
MSLIADGNKMGQKRPDLPLNANLRKQLAGVQLAEMA